MWHDAKSLCQDPNVPAGLESHSRVDSRTTSERKAVIRVVNSNFVFVLLGQVRFQREQDQQALLFNNRAARDSAR